MATGSGPLNGIRVLDLATIYAGPFSAMLLGDYGADVIKVEHPRGDPMRTHGYSKDGVGIWWKMISRNKRTLSLDLNKPEGQDILTQLVASTDVLIENFRPGVMEKWNLGYDRLSAINPKLVMLRTTGFGQAGPYSKRHGFGTLAESMSGFAYMTGQPDGPPTLPPFGLADGIAGLAGALATMFALYHRDAHGGAGQMIDLAIIEPILMLLGPQPMVYDQLGLIAERMGNRSVNNAPRNTYRTRDGRWVAVSTSANRIAERVMELVGHLEVVNEPWFSNGGLRAEHADLLDPMVADWIADRDLDEVIRLFEEAGAAVAPIYDVEQVMHDPQFAFLKTFVTLQDEDLGPMRMQNVMFRMSETPGHVRHTGRSIGQDNGEILSELLHMSQERVSELKESGVI